MDLHHVVALAQRLCRRVFVDVHAIFGNGPIYRRVVGIEGYVGEGGAREHFQPGRRCYHQRAPVHAFVQRPCRSASPLPATRQGRGVAVVSSLLRRLRLLPLNTVERVVGSVLQFQTRRWSTPANSRRPHDLSGKLIVSLTTYPGRFAQAQYTIRCLLNQTLAPDEIVLWVAHNDCRSLTPALLGLRSSGMRISECDDLRSYNKIIPALQQSPEAYIVTADDDTFYWPTWLEELVSAAVANEDSVICHRAHFLGLTPDNQIAPYGSWEKDTRRQSSFRIFPTGIGGVLYPPGAFASDVTDIASLRELCPAADDVWLYWMARLKGTPALNLASRRHYWPWPGSQLSSLRNDNIVQKGNDRQIEALVGRYGIPPSVIAGS